MEFTGERVIPGEVESDLWNEHRARYWFARRFAGGKSVLDAACGTGYGSALLAEGARSVVGADVSGEAIDYARQHFPAANLHWAQGDCMALPFADGSFEMVAAFEIIEHLKQPENFLRELRRVLDPAGMLILSTPNRLYYTDDRGEINPFHCKEFSFPEFEDALRPLFPHCAILFENHVAGIAVSGAGAGASLSGFAAEGDSRESSDASAVEEARRGAHFFVAVCSARPLGPIEPLLYLPSAANILREREMYIHDLERRVLQKDAQILQIQADYESWARSLERDLEKARGDFDSLQTDYDNKIAWAQSMERDLQKARDDLSQLQKEFEERTAWALRLDSELQLLFASRWYRLGKKLNLSPVPPSDGGPSNSGSQ